MSREAEFNAFVSKKDDEFRKLIAGLRVMIASETQQPIGPGTEDWLQSLQKSVRLMVRAALATGQVSYLEEIVIGHQVDEIFPTGE